MGITGLIPFLEKASSKINIKEISGSTVAIDTYCWLHRGAFGCAEKLSRGEPTDIHIQFCLKFVNLLLANDIKPILVFDGRHLPAKAMTEAKRREQRKESKKRGVELLRLGKTEEARSYMKRCIDITHEMALELIKECRQRNVDCIVAPYEADAQLAYLNQKNLAQFIITEDSDLVLFGCKKIIFKFDLNGNGLLVDASKIPLAMGCREDRYTFDKFRHMCILSGCDYMDSLPGIGLATACKFVLKTEETDMRRALSKLPSYLNKRSLVVTDEYKENFLKADATFRHMLVYDPLERKLLPLTDPVTTGTDKELCCNAGSYLENDIAFQLALGNLDPFTLKQLDNWDPDNNSIQKNEKNYKKSKSWNQIIIAKHESIWKINFNENFSIKKEKKIVEKNLLSFNIIKKENKLRKSQSLQHDNVVMDESITKAELLATYAEPPNKKQRTKDLNVDEESALEDSHIIENQIITPQKSKRNPFIKTKTPEIINSPTKLTKETCSLIKNISPVKRVIASPSVLNKLSKFSRTNIVNHKQKVISKFFNNDTTKTITPIIDNKDDLGIKIKSSSVDVTENLKMYLQSPEAKVNLLYNIAIERTPTKPINNLIYNDDENGIVIKNKCKNLLDSFNGESKVENGIKEEADEPVVIPETEIINISECEIIEDDIKTNVIDDNIEKLRKNKPCKRLGLSITRKKSTTQTATTEQQRRLSMFGFKKKTQI